MFHVKSLSNGGSMTASVPMLKGTVGLDIVGFPLTQNTVNPLTLSLERGCVKEEGMIPAPIGEE